MDRAPPVPVTFHVRGLNLAEEYEQTVPAGEHVSEWYSPAQNDESEEIFLQARMVGVIPVDRYSGFQIEPDPDHDYGKATVRFRNTSPTRTNLLPVVRQDFRDLSLFRGSSYPQAANATMDLLAYVHSSTDENLDYTPESSDSTVAIPTVDGTELTVRSLKEGAATVTLTAAAASDPTQAFTFEFAVKVETVDSDNFNLQVVKVGDAREGRLSVAIDSAQAFWNRMLTDAPDVFFDDPADLSCERLGIMSPLGGQQLIDDVAIVISVLPIDGPAGTLAFALNCKARSEQFAGENADQLQVLGYFQMDTDDVDRLALKAGGGLRALTAVMIHEIGHIMGIGTTWYDKDPVGGMTFDPATRFHMASVDPWGGLTRGKEIAFLGMEARDAFVDAGGTDVFSLDGTPIATGILLGGGSFGFHWGEIQMGNELMTPNYDGEVKNPFSAISLRSLVDLGWTLNPNFTPDAYSVPKLASSDAEADRGEVFDLSNDFLFGPVGTIGRDGEPGDPMIPPDALINSDANQRLREAVSRSIQAVIRELEQMYLDDPFDNR